MGPFSRPDVTELCRRNRAHARRRPRGKQEKKPDSRGNTRLQTTLDTAGKKNLSSQSARACVRFPPRHCRPSFRRRRKIMKILTHAGTTMHYPISQGPGISCWLRHSLSITAASVSDESRSRAAFNARVFGRLLSKQTFRRDAEGSRTFFNRVEARVAFYPSPRGHITTASRRGEG